MALIPPFDLKQILMVDLAGTPEIFMFVSLVILAFIMGKYKFSNSESMALFVLFVLIMSSYLLNLYILVLIFVGLFVGYAISKVTK